MGRLRPLDLVAGVGGIVLLASLFLHWYALDVPTVRTGDVVTPLVATFGDALEPTGWQAFTVTDILLVAVALLAIAVPVVTATVHGPALPIAIVVLASVAAPLAALLIGYRMLNEPGPNDIVELRAGAWIGLAGALIAFAGSFGALKDESTPGAVAPDVPRRPAPPAAAA